MHVTAYFGFRDNRIFKYDWQLQNWQLQNWHFRVMLTGKALPLNGGPKVPGPE